MRPPKERPWVVEKLFGNKELGDNAVFGSAENPVEIPWMINAVLRERSDHPIPIGVRIINCNFDQDCVRFFLARGNVVVGIADIGGDNIRSNLSPFIINFSLLTSRLNYTANTVKF